MSNDLEDRLRTALHAVPEPPPSGDAYARNLQRLQQRRRRTARAGVALAAAAALFGVLVVPGLDLGRDDTLGPAAPSADDRRPDGEVVETLTVLGRGFDLIWLEDRRDYRLCASQPPYACSWLPLLEELSSTAVAVPVDDGAVLFVGRLGNPELVTEDVLVTGQPGAEPLRADVEFVDSRVLGYRLAVFEVPTLEPAYCAAFQGGGSFGITTVNGGGDVC